MKRIPSICCIVLLAVFSLFLLAAGILTYTFNKNPAESARMLAEHFLLPERGMTLSIEKASLSLFPRPSASVSGLVIRTPGASLIVDAGILYPDLRGLLRGVIQVRSIRLHEPSLILKQDEIQDDSRKPFDFPSSLAGMHLEVENGSIQYFQSGPDRNDLLRLRMTGLSGSCEFPRVGRGPGTLSFSLDRLEWSGETAEKAKKTAPAFNLEHSVWRLSEVRWGRADESGHSCLSGTVECRIPFPNRDKTPEAAVKVFVRSEDGQLFLDGVASMQGKLPLLQQIVPLRALVPFSTTLTAAQLGRGILPIISIRGASIDLDRDSAVFSGKLVPPGHTPATLEGTLDVVRFSLPRWFRFARELPPGIQKALDALSGRLVFTLTPQALSVTSLTARVLDVDFRGTGGVGSFANPVVALRASAHMVPLNSIFPGVSDKPAVAPGYSQPPLFGRTEKAHAPGYDIQLSAEKGTFWKWAGSDLSVQITPEQPDGAGPSRIAMRCGSLYGGAARGELVTGKELSLALSFDDVNAEAFSAPMAGNLSAKGKVTGSAAVKGPSGTFAAFLSGLKGKIELHLEKGEIFSRGSGKKSFAFSRMNLAFQGMGRPASLENHYAYAGDWQGSFVSPEGQADIHLTGQLQFPEKGTAQVIAEDVPLSGKGTYNRYSLQGNGKFSVNTEEASLSLRDFVGQAGVVKALMACRGSLRGMHLHDRPEWEGTGSLSSDTFRRVLQESGMDVSGIPSSSLNSFRASVSFRHDGTSLFLTELDGCIDDASFSGHLERTAGTPQRWTGQLKLGTVRLAEYLPHGQHHPGTPWNGSWLKACELDGTVAVEKLVIAGLAHENLNAPVRLKKGVLTLDPIRGRLADGSIGAGLRLESLPGGLGSRLRYTLSGVDVLTLCRERGQTKLISGTGNLDADVSGKLGSGADIPGALVGHLGFSVRDGDLDVQHPGPLNRFSLLTATGTLGRSVITTRDLNLSGPMSARGGGVINLADWTLDYTMSVTAPGLPEIPVRYSGSLGSPHRTVNTTGLLSNTFSSIGNGVLRILDSAVSVPLRLITP